MKKMLLAALTILSLSADVIANAYVTHSGPMTIQVGPAGRYGLEGGGG